MRFCRCPRCLADERVVAKRYDGLCAVGVTELYEPDAVVEIRVIATIAAL